MIRIRALVLTFATIAVATASQAASFNLNETKDGSVYSFSSSSSMLGFSFGPPGYLPVASSPPVGGGTHFFNSYMQFSLTPLTSAGVTAAQVSHATITLQTSDISLFAAAHSNAPTASSPYTVDLFAAKSSWNLSTTWDTQPGAPASSPFNLPVDSETLTQVSNGASIVLVNFDVTSLVQAWLSGALTNNGVFMSAPNIVGDAENGFTSALFTSRGYNTLDQDENIVFVPQSGGPVLNVQTVPEPSTAVLLGLAGVALVAWGKRRRQRRA